MSDKRTVNRPEALLAYAAVAAALSIRHDLDDLRRLAELTADVADVDAAATAMGHAARTGEMGGGGELVIAAGHFALTKRAEARKQTGTA